MNEVIMDEVDDLILGDCQKNNVLFYCRPGPQNAILMDPFYTRPKIDLKIITNQDTWQEALVQVAFKKKTTT